jgi:hypothetical protein
MFMNGRKRLTKIDTGEGPPPPAGSESYVCVDPSQRGLVFDFFKGFHQDQKIDVLAHLGLCLQCRESLSIMLRLDKYSHPARENYLHPERPGEVAPEVEGVSVD